MRAITLLLMLFFLTACSSMPRLQGESPSWEFKGKVSLRIDRNTEVANIHWRQSGRQSLIRLTGPIGLGAVTIEADEQVMTITSAEGVSVIPAGEPLQVDGYGLRLPWQAMSSWVRGQSVKRQPIPDTGLEQDGWEIQILKSGPNGPSLMTFVHEQVTVRLSVSEWRLGPQNVESDSI